jgi:hypothetical protein
MFVYFSLGVFLSLFLPTLSTTTTSISNMSGYTSGRGNFGDHSGRAHGFLSPTSGVHDVTDPLQKFFWDHKVYVDVRSIEFKASTGRNQARIVGSEAQIAAARELCQKLDLPIDLVCTRIPPTP